MYLIPKALFASSRCHCHSDPSLYDTKQDAGEDQRKYHDEGQSDACATDDTRVLLQCSCRDIITTVVVRVIQCWPTNARFPLTLVDLLATGQWYVAFPIAEIIHATALQSGLCLVPCASYQFPLAV